ncbi:exosortase family protein XrtF [Croceimicrobium hydrocarbonivorans]|uniref:Exosortase family protein XrtF n=1 Tax=Croceimicrobium hydrocarbonivorans TaxID=2761580 RepID=A0A7H0VGG8_9FLAO|nr:exosortase family protein XrtF [Croceimicrobium hydrocarbonivorans]QNR24816.1 exosortase family protein XrtF [Croceimicrobium hydrocarbonivorans]
MWKEFKPTILFLIKFISIYLVGSGLYGYYISNYDLQEKLDPITRWVTYQCAGTAGMFGYDSEVVQNDHLAREENAEQTYDSLWLDRTYAISVEEGCNGINIMILFVAFVIGFGGKFLNTLLFIPAGLLFIHFANLGRLMLLSVLNVDFDGKGFHFFHKYGFTAVLYLAILILWYFWVMHWNGKSRSLAKKSEKDA